MLWHAVDLLMIGDSIMRATFLGTGTSCGVPIIGCDCAVCCSTDPRDRRLRTSLYVEVGEAGVLVDTPPDFRVQALTYSIPRVDAVLFTHAHADHIFGFDDIRRYNTLQGGVIPAYGHPEVLADLRRAFHYIDAGVQPGIYRAQIDYREVEGLFCPHDGLLVQPLPVVHGDRPVFGYCFEAGDKRLAYVPDCKVMQAETEALLHGVDVMVLDALRHRPHKTHMTLEESLACLARIGAKRSYLIHMCHELSHAELEAQLPAGVYVSYDGLQLEL